MAVICQTGCSQYLLSLAVPYRDHESMQREHIPLKSEHKSLCRQQPNMAEQAALQSDPVFKSMEQSQA